LHILWGNGRGIRAVVYNSGLSRPAALTIVVRPIVSRISQLIDVLQKRSDVGVVQQGQSWRVVITKGQDLFCELTIPHDVLEWFACVKSRKEKREVWSDWMDYNGYNDSPKEVLEAKMADDILAFIDRVSVSEHVFPLRIFEKRT
jgi:hypothetical protein